MFGTGLKSQHEKCPQRFEALRAEIHMDLGDQIIAPGETNFVLLSLDGEQAWLEVLGLADPPHPVHFLWSHWALVQSVKRCRQVGG